LPRFRIRRQILGRKVSSSFVASVTHCGKKSEVRRTKTLARYITPLQYAISRWNSKIRVKYKGRRSSRGFQHTVGRDVPNSHFQLRDEKTRLSVPGYKNSGTKDRQNRSFPFQGQCTQKHVKYWNSGTKRHDFYQFWENFNRKTEFFLKINSGSIKNLSQLLSHPGDEQVKCLTYKILTRTIFTKSEIFSKMFNKVPHFCL
jgi:hypothetical protein